MSCTCREIQGRYGEIWGDGLLDGGEGKLVPRELVDLALVSEVRAVELVRELALALGRSLAAARALGHADVVGAQGGDRALGEARAH